MSIRIVVVDDHRILRAGLKTLLQTDPNFEVIGEATSGEEAVEVVQVMKPDIVLLDIGMAGMDGLMVTERLTQLGLSTRILILTMHEDSTMLQECLRRGASGYIIKRAAESELIDAIYAVWRGMIYIHPSLMRSLVAPIQKPSPPANREPDELTTREVEILRYIVQGHTNRQIADALSISVRTVETHRSNIMEKLNLHTRVDLVRYASAHNLIKPEEIL